MVRFTAPSSQLGHAGLCRAGNKLWNDTLLGIAIRYIGTALAISRRWRWYKGRPRFSTNSSIMPLHISSKMPTIKTVRFADSPNDMYSYDSDQAPSPIATRSSQTPFGKSSTSEEPPNMYYYSRSLDDTPSPEYHQSLLPGSSPTFSSFASPLSSSPALPSPLPSTSSFHPPPTPDGLQNPISLPPVEEVTTPTTVGLHEYLCPLHLNIDLSKDISPYIPEIPDEPATSPPLPGDMVLVSKYLPWRIHIAPSSVQDVVVALYTALRTRVTEEELKTTGGTGVTRAFANRVEGMGEEERQKGVRRVDFLLGYTRFIGVEATDEPGVWKICLASLS
ncbi:uncharacterized protein EV420DRAFT_238236 [Desarmillaria tabescens]|uniref:DUF6699 domain-containing protein n=1 Tax=Armillaria tabescens TaxID=1929756 RepID=A0AA39MIV0_ARMTA|nr:uncharacterized protein EV420DRAFT_238236 [Desarmillaria tabescens]KAK0436501.1 hypothetical protein EV420DRAFT_238236 [Desarmillaria tabescens]